MRAHPEYREGIRWAPRLPAHWRSASLRWLAAIYAGGTPDKENLEYWTGGEIPWLNSGAVNDWSITTPSALITADAFANSSAKWVPAGSVVMGLAGQGKTKGTAARLEFDATTNQSMAAIVPQKALDYRFLHFWLAGNYQSIRNLAGGDLRDGLNLQHVGGIQVPVPPIDEQCTIAAYLDRETARIDTLIEEQQRLVEMLRERRTAVLAHALSVRAPEVPFVRCMTQQVDYRGATPTKTDSGVQLVTARNIKTGWVDYEASREFVDREEYDTIMRRGLPRVGDLLFTMEAPLGNIAVVDREDIALAQRVIKWSVNRAMAEPRFLMYAALGDNFQDQLRARATGSTALGIKASKLPELRIGLPPLAEQRAIVAHLDVETARIDTLIAETERFIELSRERRSALITAAVTGQIDVRDEAA